MWSGSTIAAGFLRGLADHAASRGADRAVLLAQAGLSPADVADPDRHLPFATYVALMRAGQELCGDPALALHFGEAVDLAELSVLGHVGNPGGGMREGLAVVARYASLTVRFSGLAGERIQFREEGGDLWLVDRRPHPNAFPEFTEAAFARMVCTAQRVLGLALASELRVTHAEPPYLDEYVRIFQAPVRFGQVENALRIPKDVLALATPPDEPYVSGVLRAHADTLLARLGRDTSTRGRVEAALDPLLPGGKAGMEAVARALGTTRQTLFRRLREEGTTFEQVLDALRQRLAFECLEEGSSVAETADRLGFSEPAAFSRAFKRWTGAAPGSRKRRPGR